VAVNSKLNFDIFARDKASPVFNKFGREVRSTDKSTRGLSSGVKGLAKGFAGLIVVQKATAFFKEANAEARESQKVNALTAAALKSTGAAAWASTKGIGALSTAISNKTGIDDEAIQSGSNLLLTFKNVRNEVGKGNDIFNQATQSAVDLSAAGFGSIEGASKMLGKALNDPIKGISALGRAGVQFTDQQKKQIKEMVKAGDVLGAQKIIMKEVQSQTGGAAAAQATAADKMKVAWANFKEQIGTALIPVLDKLAVAGSSAIAWLQKNPDAMKAILIGLVAIGVAMAAVVIAAYAIPIAIGAVVAALVYAYTHFETFRKVVDSVAKFAFEAFRFLWNNGLRPVLLNIAKGFGLLLMGWGKMLQALGKVPGFGWAKKAGDAMFDAGKKALNLGDHIEKIPSLKDIKFKSNADSVRRSIEKLNAASRAGKGRSIHYSNGYGGGQTANAMGTSNFSGGATWVGERGPELVDLPAGSRITPSSKSQAMVANSGGNAAEAAVAKLMSRLEQGLYIQQDSQGKLRLALRGA
jgi:hypothetical protein